MSAMLKLAEMSMSFSFLFFRTYSTLNSFFTEAKMLSCRASLTFLIRIIKLTEIIILMQCRTKQEFPSFSFRIRLKKVCSAFRFQRQIGVCVYADRHSMSSCLSNRVKLIEKNVEVNCMCSFVAVKCNGKTPFFSGGFENFHCSLFRFNRKVVTG